MIAPNYEQIRKSMRLRSLAALLLAALFSASNVQAQPAGWSEVQPFNVAERSGTSLTGYQIRLVIDTAALITAGHLRPDGGDLRFGTAADGGASMDYYLESGLNTSSTVVWVKLAALPAFTTRNFYMFHGNPGATSASTLDVFDFTDNVTNSATNQVTGGGAGGVTNSQRGFRFVPNQDVLLTHLGKNEPNGTTRYVTLFDFDTEAQLAQLQVAGPAGTYSYSPLPTPLWLQQGKQYVLQIYQGSTDGYYFGASQQINPALTYLDMRYCNGCTQDTFPTNDLNAIHYGYSDFLMRTRQQVAPAPVLAWGFFTPQNVPIPTLSTWALAGLSVMLALLSISRARRQSSSRRTGTSLFLCVLGVLLYIPATPSAAGTSCLADTSQSNFLAGVLTNIDLNTSPGDAMLMSGLSVDQQNTAGTTTGTGFDTPTWTGQTFTAAMTGTLVQAGGELFCNGCGATPPDLTLSVRATSAGLPTGADLASTTISGSAFASGSVTSFAATFSTPAALVAGTQYALILRPVSAPAGIGYFWVRSSPSTYSGGSRVLSADSGGTWSADTTRDFNFKTYIDPGYLPSGDLVSSLKDASAATSWIALSWTSLVPVNTTLQFHVAASNNPAGPFNFVGPDGTAATYFQSSSASLSQFNGFRYLKYKAYLATTDSAVTPLLNDATVCFVSQDGLAAVPTLTEWGLILLSAALALLGVMMRRYLS